VKGGEEMKEIALRRRVSVLIVAALLSAAGAFGTSAFLAAHDAEAGTIINQPNSGSCIKIPSYPYWKCF
jgi:hypothetical protein